MKLHNMKIKTTFALLAIACSFAAMPKTFAEKADTVVPAKATLAAQEKTGSASFEDAVQR